MIWNWQSTSVPFSVNALEQGRRFIMLVSARIWHFVCSVFIFLFVSFFFGVVERRKSIAGFRWARAIIMLGTHGLGAFRIAD